MHKLFLSLLLFFILSTAAHAGAVGDDTDLQSGQSAYAKGNYRKSVILFQKALSGAKPDDGTHVFHAAANGLGNAYSQLGESERALKYYLLSISKENLQSDNTDRARTYKNIGALYAEQKDFTAARLYYDKAIAIAAKFRETLLQADCLNNIGVVSEQIGELRSAENYYNKALAMYRAAGNSQRISMALNNLAIVFKLQGDYKRSILHYEQALEIAQRDGDKFTIAATQNNLGNVYAKKGDYAKSLAMCLQAYDEATGASAQEVVVEALDGIATAYEGLGQFAGALRYRKLYEQEYGNYISSERITALAEMNTRFESAEKDAAIRELEQNKLIRELQLQEQQSKIRSRNLLLAGCVILLLVLAGSVWLWKGRQAVRSELARQNAIRDTEEQERLRIARDIHDDLGSGLSKINFLSEIIIQKTAHIPEALSSTESVRDTAAKMIENMRDLIWALNPENTTLANLVARMREYTTDYFEEADILITYRLPDELPQTPITKEAHRELFMVVKETLNNISRHANATEVIFTIDIDERNFRLVITDNGQGFDNGAVKGNGLRNMQTRIRSLGGIFGCSSVLEKGSTTQLELPLEKIIRKDA